MTRDEQILSLETRVRVTAIEIAQKIGRISFFHDLYQAGWCGAIQAVDGFDPSRGWALNTYARHRIRGAILDYLKSAAFDPQIRRIFRKTTATYAHVETAGLNPWKLTRP